MSEQRIFGLTKREIEVMRLVVRNRGTDEIARVLNIFPETVQSHIKHARAKAGGIDRFALANAIAEWEGRPQSIVTPALGIAPPPVIAPDAPVSNDGTELLARNVLREERAVFDISEERVPVPAMLRGVSVNDLSAPERLARIGTIAFQIVAGLATLAVAMAFLQRFILNR